MAGLTSVLKRFAFRGEAVFASQGLSAMRHAFGGHVEKPAEGDCRCRAAAFGRPGRIRFSGDLAAQMILPALYAMVNKGHLTVPVIGVASSRAEIDEGTLKRRAAWSLGRIGLAQDARVIRRGHQEHSANFCRTPLSPHAHVHWAFHCCVLACALLLKGYGPFTARCSALSMHRLHEVVR